MSEGAVAAGAADDSGSDLTTELATAEAGEDDAVGGAADAGAEAGAFAAASEPHPAALCDNAPLDWDISDERDAAFSIEEEGFAACPGLLDSYISRI